MTGDGGDELFAGYSFFFDLDKEHLDSALADLWANMRFLQSTGRSSGY